MTAAPLPPDEALPLSPVYSLAVHHQALWLLSGTETGAINLQSVRHDEGKRITSLWKHSSAVSVMVLSQDQNSFLSGSWDKTMLDWDLNTGQVKRSFLGSKAQISALEMRPTSSIPVPRDTFMQAQDQSRLRNNSTARAARSALPTSTKDQDKSVESKDGAGSPADSLFGGNEDHDSLFGDNDGGATDDFGLGEDNEISRAIASDIKHQDKLDADGDSSMRDIQNGNDKEETDSNTQRESSQPTEQGESTNQPDANNANGDDTGLETSNGLLQSSMPESQDVSESTFLDAAIDGTLRIWDRRQPSPIARIIPQRSVPPWCMHASWSPDGNFIYAGRRNGTVDEYSLHKGLRDPVRSLRFPAGSGAVSAVRAMPNGRHLVW